MMHLDEYETDRKVALLRSVAEIKMEQANFLLQMASDLEADFDKALSDFLQRTLPRELRETEHL